MAALDPSLLKVLHTVQRVFNRPKSGLRTHGFDPDDGLFLRGSGQFKFSADPELPKQGYVRVVGSPSGFKIEVFADFMDNPIRKVFAPRYHRRNHKLPRHRLRSPSVRKFATHAVLMLKMHFRQQDVQHVHDL